jgi:Fe-S cluster biogenesis protein NfuA
VVEVGERVRRVEGLIENLEHTLNPVMRGQVQEIVGLLLDLHAEGLERLLGRLLQAGDAGRSLLVEAARDDAIGGLLLLHGLHPLGLEERVRGALDGVRPYLTSHGGNVELVGLDERGVLSLRLEGSCHGCPSSSATLKSTIEQAIRAAAPDVTEIVVVGADASVQGAAR